MVLESTEYEVTSVEASVDLAWDALVEVAGGDLAQTTLWAASRQRLGFRAYRIMITTARQELLGGCLMYVKRVAPAWWVASIPRGPVVFTPGPGATSVVVREIVAAAGRAGVRVLIIQRPEAAPLLDGAMAEIGFRPGVPSLAPEATVRLDLRRSDEELLSSMSGMRRRNLRKALRSGLEVSQDDDIELFHRLHVVTAHRQGFVPATRENLQAQWNLLAPHARCAMFIARYHGVAAAGIWVTRFAGAVTFKLAGWDASSPAPPHASDAVQWAAIQWARSNGDSTYDFGGFDRHSAECLVNHLPMSDDFHRSPSFYKLGFGGSPVLLPRARFLLLPKLADVALGRAAQSLFGSSRGQGLAQHYRNGRIPGRHPPQGLRYLWKDSALQAVSGCVRLVRPAYLQASRAAARFSDRRFGVTTSDEEVVRELGRASNDDYRYVSRAISYLGIERLIRKLEPNRTDAFLDMGCGAGRAICIAAQHPFSRVIGIEVDEGLCALAELNARRLRRYVVRPETICADATKYRVPDDVTVVFLYNPFNGEVLRAALTQVLESFDRAPRRLRLAYANPRDHELIASMHRFRTTGKMWLSWRPEAEWHRTKVVQFYEVEPHR
jgi:predicted RNA methylase